MSDFKSGFIAIAGRPNMGKSTLLNHLLGKKIAIVTPKAQTTRHRIMGVKNLPNAQMVFLDTPGIHFDHKSALNKAMVETAFEACKDVDALIYMVEAGKGLLEEDLKILKKLPKKSAPVVLVMNKADLIKRPEILPRMAQAAEMDEFAEIIPLSAQTGENCERLIEALKEFLPFGPQYFPEDQTTDQPERFIVAEVVREKLFLNLQKELPYSVGVQVEAFKEEEGLLSFHVLVVVERESQKGIVIGKGGSVLKRVGMAARKDLEGLFGVKIFLKLFVKVKKDWTSDDRAVRDWYAD